MHRRHTSQARTRHRAAMIRILAADDDLFIGLPHRGPVMSGHPNYSIVSLRAGISEESMVETAGVTSDRS